MLKKVVLVIAAAGLLAGCAERWDIGSARLAENAGGAYEKALQKEFADLAEVQKAQSDWDDVEVFVARARLVANGGSTEPSAYNARRLQDSFLPEAMQMRAALVEKLNAGAARTAPALLARTQVAGYECWLEEAETGVRSVALDACRTAFDEGMKSLETGPVPAQAVSPAAPVAGSAAAPFVVLFKPGSAVVDDVAMSVIDAAVSAYGARKPVTVIIAGHTDAVGSPNTNIVLSQKRAEAVASVLAKKGVDSSAMSLEAYGEEKPKVSNGDIADEGANRRVEVFFRK